MPKSTVSEERLVRLNEVLKLTGLCRSSVYQLMRRSEFPEQIPIGPRAVAWVLTEILDWIRCRVDSRRGKSDDDRSGDFDSTTKIEA